MQEKAILCRSANVGFGLMAAGLMCLAIAAPAAWGEATVLNRLSRQNVPLVMQGEPKAVVVTADDPALITEYAVDEFVAHIEKATGAALEVVAESDLPVEADHRVFIGETKAAAEAGIEAEALGPDTFALRTIGNDLFILGRTWADEDHPRMKLARELSWKQGRGQRLERDPLSKYNPWSGTLFGVYEVLEREVGVRWLWPGELGTYVPESQTLVVSAVNEVVEPRLAFRQFRRRHINHAIDEYESRLKRLAFSEDALRAYSHDLNVYLRRHRMGFSEIKPIARHMRDLWEEHGESNPEWFMLSEDGERGPVEGRSTRHVPLCVSSTGLHRHIIETYWDGGDVLPLGGADERIFCHCEDCRAWDGPTVESPPDVAASLYDPDVSNRYARFWETILEQAKQRNPDVTLAVLLYWNYLSTPTADVDLDTNVHGTFVPWGGDGQVIWYPMSDAADQWLREQWLGWRDLGLSMEYRPNYLLGGYNMPMLSTWQVGRFFKFAYDHGMVGIDFDSLYGHWATRGPMLYLHMRLAVDPTQGIGELRREYFTAFGPAAEAVERYFDYWEDYTVDERIASRFNGLRSISRAHAAYPPETFEPAARMLDEALEAAEQDSNDQYAERVRFLRAGLEHARLSARLSSPKRQREDLQKLIEFRRAHEDQYISDYIADAQYENRSLPIDELLEEGDDEDARQPLGLLPAIGETWQFRIDPDDEGEQRAWHRGESESGWIDIPVPGHWQNTEVGNYHGFAWYRTHFDVPAELAAQALTIDFRGVDEQAWVYLNGELVGEQTEESTGKDVSKIWNEPFTVTLSADQLREGPNLLAVRVHSHANLSGIFRPVRLYQLEE